MDKIPVGVSACLLGDPVRFDGGHKHDRYLTEVLGQYLSFQPVCPEVAIGLGVPRKPIRIQVTDRGERIRGVVDPELDVTDALVAQAEHVAAAFPRLCGYIFMHKSPSCGVFDMKRYAADGQLLDTAGQGAYARRLMELMPLMPVEESGRLKDAGLRDNFVTRVFAFYDWRRSVEDDPSPRKLIEFYSRYKYLVMAHHLPSYGALGRLLADLSGPELQSICDEFIRGFMAALRRPATRKGNTNAMMHLRGYLKGVLQAPENDELDQVIRAYQQGEVPLIVPLTLLRHHLMKVDNPYLKHQAFWAPHPEKLGLRNAITK